MSKVNQNQIKKVYEYSVTREKVLEVRDEKLNSPDVVADFVLSLNLNDSEREHFIVLFLDTRNKLKGYQVVSVGTQNTSQVHPREVYRLALVMGAVKIIVAHNHPTNDLSPSIQDIQSTNRLIEAGKTLGVPLMDHLIVSDDDYHSMRENFNADFEV